MSDATTRHYATSALELALAELQAFGHADQIASFLAGRGLKGKPGNKDCCPLAKFLQARGLLCARVGEYAATAFRNGEPVPLPGPVLSFRMRFDDGMYPDLATP